MTFKPDFDFAQSLDREDPLSRFRSKFHIPQKNGKDIIYFCGNSLGLQPKSVKTYITEELYDWEKLGVEGHFSGKRPWVHYHNLTKPGLAELLGASPNEVVAMGSLTENLHLLLNAFYHPEPDRNKILIEKMAFPSDHYAVSSQLKMHGFGDASLITLEPDQGYNFSTEHIIRSIQYHGNELALILLPGVQYFSGQLFDISAIASAAHQVGALIGFDLAHAVGNVPLHMHEHQVDFATWCSYKYLNSGPGGISGIFVHEKHLNADRQLKGWWGHHPNTRFKMDNQWVASEGVDAWQLSNPNILASAAHLASLEIFQEAGISSLRTKSLQLTSYLEYLINVSELSEQVQIITPSNPDERGAQLSLMIEKANPALIEKLSEKGVILDYREPKVIRVAPVPLYNSFSDVWNFVNIITQTLKNS